MREHGSFELEITGRLLKLKAYDAWNYETAKRWGKETRELVDSIKNRPWMCLCDLTEWELATPDIQQYVLDLNLWLDANNLKYLAIIYKTGLQKAVLQKSHKVFINVKVEYFNGLQEGDAWLMGVSGSLIPSSSHVSNY